MSPLLTYKTAAAVLDCSASTVQKMVLAGEIPVVKVGNETRIDPADLQAWIDQRKYFHQKKHSERNSKQPVPTEETALARSK